MSKCHNETSRIAISIKQTKTCGSPVAHTRSPCDSEGRDKEDLGSNTAWANSLQDPVSKTPITKKGLVNCLKVESLSSSPSSAPHTKTK